MMYNDGVGVEVGGSNAGATHTRVNHLALKLWALITKIIT